jgi:hypothetical protein
MEIDWESMMEPEEWVVGAAFGISFLPFMGWWGVLSAALCAFLWRLGGVKGGDKLFRRVGVPVVVGTFLILGGSISLSWALLSACLSFGVLSLGYGIPDGEDAGSALGRFWCSIIKEKNVADAITRGTIGLLFGIAWFPLLFVKMPVWAACALFLAFAFPAVEEFVE